MTVLVAGNELRGQGLYGDGPVICILLINRFSLISLLHDGVDGPLATARTLPYRNRRGSNDPK